MEATAVLSTRPTCEIQAAQQPGSPLHIPALDALRGVAVLMVTLYHVGGMLPGPAASGARLIPGLSSGVRGVDLFFVLSGFLITGILYDTKASPHYFLNFYARRTLRIMPLYYGVLVVAFMILPWLTGQMTWQREAVRYSTWLWLYGSNVLLAWRGEWCFGAFDHFWSLAVEEQFYLAWPLVVLLLPRRRTMDLCGLLFCGVALGRVLWVLADGNEVTRYVLTLFRLDSLAAGAWIALYIRGGSHIETLRRPAKVVLIILTVVLIPVSIAELRLLSLTDALWNIFFATLLIVMLQSSDQTVLGRVGQSRILGWLGKYSYGIYVFGNLLIFALAPFLTASDLALRLRNVYAGQLAYALILGTVTMCLAYCSWHLIEKRFLVFKRYFEAAPKGAVISVPAHPVLEVRS